MADYYTNFSVVLPLTKEQREYAMQLAAQVEAHKHEEAPLPESFPPGLKDGIEDWYFETEADDEGVWLHSQYGGQGSACAFIQHLLQKFSFAGGVTFEWSHDCSQPRTDAFGGGAALVTANDIERFTTSEWLAEVTGTRKHVFSPDTQLCIKCGLHADDDLVENTLCTR
jgi:hypothetical protein